MSWSCDGSGIVTVIGTSRESTRGCFCEGQFLDAPDVVRTIPIERLDLNTTDIDEDLETTRLFMVKTRSLRCPLKFANVFFIIFNGFELQF